MKRLGFTMIELLVVISVIGLVASAVLAALSVSREKARVAKANADLKQLVTSIEFKRDQSNAVLLTITGSGYTAGGNGGVCLATDLRNISDSSSCGAWLNTQMQKLGFVKAPRDPWNSPYMMDENEQEYINDPCRKDSIRSNGPDGIFGNSDDITVQINFFNC